MSNNTNKSNLLETVLCVASTLAMLIAAQHTSINQNKKSDKTNEIQENVYHIHATPFTDPKSAKDYAKLAAKLQEAERETDDFWRVRRVEDIVEFLEDKDDCIKAYAITELTRIASNMEDDFWRSRMLNKIYDI